MFSVLRLAKEERPVEDKIETVVDKAFREPVEDKEEAVKAPVEIPPSSV